VEGAVEVLVVVLGQEAGTKMMIVLAGVVGEAAA
jgi:hypothetical protein